MFTYLVHLIPFILLFLTMAAFSFMPSLSVYLPFSKFLAGSPYLSGMAVMVSSVLLVARMFGYLKAPALLRVLLVLECVLLGNFVFGPMQLAAGNHLPDCFWTALMVIGCNVFIFTSTFTQPSTAYSNEVSTSPMFGANISLPSSLTGSAYPALPTTSYYTPSQQQYGGGYIVNDTVYQLESKKYLN